MKPLSLLDIVVFFSIVLVSVISEISTQELLYFAWDILLHIPLIIWTVLKDSLGLSRHEASHYRNATNPLQQFIVLLLGYAFDRVHYRIGRLFLSSKSCLRFARWRRGKNPPFASFTIAGSEKHKDVLVYQFQARGEHQVKQVILYVHGGGLIVGSVPFYSEFLEALASRCSDTVVLSPEYDLVPESSFPVQFNQIQAVHKYITLRYPGTRITVGGDSAGAGLCQSLLLSLSVPSSGQRIHKAFYVSPWLDFAGVTTRSAGAGDYISPDAVDRYGKWYTDGLLGSASLAGFEASPLNCSGRLLAGSVPEHGMFIICGGAECLLSDSLTFVSRLKEYATSNVRLHVEPNEIHAFVLTNLYLRRGSRRWSGFNRIIDFLDTETQGI